MHHLTYPSHWQGILANNLFPHLFCPLFCRKHIQHCHCFHLADDLIKTNYEIQVKELILVTIQYLTNHIITHPSPQIHHYNSWEFYIGKTNVVTISLTPFQKQKQIKFKLKKFYFN